MHILRFDSVGGASGDMLLAALIDLGVPVEVIREAVASLPIEPVGIEVSPRGEFGLHGTRVRVSQPEGASLPHRVLGDVRGMILASRLPPLAKKLAVATFENLAVAEARVHNTTPEAIHFHEIGALDSIADIVGACAAVAHLDVEAVTVGPLPLGCGWVRCAHGSMPVPVPAVVELLKGHVVVQTDQQGEMVTPSGAALLTTWKTRLPELRGAAQALPDLAARPGVILKAGNGFGSAHFAGRPNLLRAMLLDLSAASEETPEDAILLECNLDDTTPEIIGALSRKLMDLGALDVFTAPISMKKDRPGTLLSVLVRAADRARGIETIFLESTTFGIRESRVQRTVLDRRFETVTTPYGPVRIKIGSWKGRDITRSPEHEDCLRCAREAGVPLRQVYDAAARKGG